MFHQYYLLNTGPWIKPTGQTEKDESVLSFDQHVTGGCSLPWSNPLRASRVSLPGVRAQRAVTWAAERCWKFWKGRYAIRFPVSLMSDCWPLVMLEGVITLLYHKPNACCCSRVKLFKMSLMLSRLQKKNQINKMRWFGLNFWLNIKKIYKRKWF